MAFRLKGRQYINDKEKFENTKEHELTTKFYYPLEICLILVVGDKLAFMIADVMIWIWCSIPKNIFQTFKLSRLFSSDRLYCLSYIYLWLVISTLFGII